MKEHGLNLVKSRIAFSSDAMLVQSRFSQDSGILHTPYHSIQ
jgi:hypothetical protein